MKNNSRKKGRPSKKTPELLKEICQRLAGGESLRKICADSHMPDITNVLNWIQADELFYQQYARARELQMELMAEEILELSDDKASDGEAFVGINHVHRARLQVDTRKWLMSKLAPKKYGDKLNLEHSGGLDIKKVTVEIVNGAKDKGE